MTHTLKLSPPLAELAVDPSQVTAASLWEALPAEDRRRAIALAVTADRQLRSVLVGAIRKTPRYRSFRADSFNAWPPDRIAASVAAPGILPAEAIEAGLIALHLGDRAQMLGAFLDSLGVPHEGGLIKDAPEDLVLSAADLTPAADALAARFPPDHVVVYLMTLMLVDRTLWGGLESWLASRGGAAAG